MLKTKPLQTTIVGTFLLMALLLGSSVSHALAAEKGPDQKKEYWLGILCGPVPDVLRAHLDLPPESGLLVEDVVKDAPADKAGLRVYDVLLQAADKPLRTPTDLVEAVNQAADKPLKLRFVRQGKETEVTVTPEIRPEADSAAPLLDPELDLKAWEKWLERFGGKPGQPPLTFRFFHPGTLMSEDALNLPKDMKVTITKSGNEPARIVVKQGDKTWEIKENELDKLPDEIRPHVEHMLSGFGWTGRGFALRKVIPPSFDGVSKTPLKVVPSPDLDRLGSVERRLEELQERLERLERQLFQENGTTGDASQAAPADGSQSAE